MIHKCKGIFMQYLYGSPDKEQNIETSYTFLLFSALSPGGANYSATTVVKTDTGSM
jgi:hypothetical protein